MKRCPKCDTWKNEDEFGKDKHTKSGLKCWCKKCKVNSTREYTKTFAGKMSRKRYNDSEFGKQRNRERLHKFQKTDKAKTIKHRYYVSDKGQATVKRALESAKNNGKLKARKVINDAIFRGKMQPAKDFECFLKDKTCSQKMDYHHYKGYDPENYFNVIPLCRSHHYRVDNNQISLVVG